MPRPFFVGFVARSGSSALAFDLRAHPLIAMELEAFGTPALPPWEGPPEQNDANRLAWLESFWRHKRPKRARGFKYQFNWKQPQFNDEPALARFLFDRSVVLIRLRRRDIARHAVSALRAQILQKISLRTAGHDGAHIYPGAPAEIRTFAQTPIEVDIDAFEAMLGSIARSSADRDAFFDLAGPTIDIDYEDYLADRLAVLNEVAAAVEVEPFDVAPPEKLTKNTSDDLREAVTNFAELSAAAGRHGLRL